MATTLVLATLVSPVASFAQTQADPRMYDLQFEGCTSQFFQRLVMQQCGTQAVGTMNPDGTPRAALNAVKSARLAGAI